MVKDSKEKETVDEVNPREEEENEEGWEVKDSKEKQTVDENKLGKRKRMRRGGR